MTVSENLNFTLITLEFVIDVGPGTFSKNNKYSPLNKRSPLLNSRQFDSFIHSQRKRKLKILKKLFKNQKSINIASFNKDVAPGKNLKN